MPIAGKLVTKINPKAILAFGIAVAGYSVHMMAQFNLQVDFETIFWPRVVLGVGMGFLFIPLTTMTMSSIRKEEMGNATAIFNLLRNLGGSFGVAFITTMLARRAQFHQVHLVEHMTPFDRNFQIALPQISQLLKDRGFNTSMSDQGSLGLIYSEVIKQASMLSFNDAFYLLSTMMMLILPLVLLMKKGKAEGPSGPGVH
jgi:DHA2 family multidrug resistance protein